MAITAITEILLSGGGAILPVSRGIDHFFYIDSIVHLYGIVLLRACSIVQLSFYFIKLLNFLSHSQHVAPRWSRSRR